MGVVQSVVLSSEEAPMNHRSWLATPARFARRSRLLAATALVAALATALTVLPAPAASAASTQPGDFSSMVSPNPHIFYVDDCVVEAGWIYNRTRVDFLHIGGARVNCSTMHSVIDVTVAMYYYAGGRWIQYNSGTRAVKYNTYGGGRGNDGIVYTPGYCVGSLKAYYWMVGATVRTERAGWTDYSPPMRNTTDGC
jgi:hypothetical protein